MPTLIRQALFERISKLPEMRRHLESLRAATGVTVAFVGPMGQESAPYELPPLCSLMREEGNVSGRQGCQRCLQRLLERAMEAPAHEVCPLGLRETAVPLRVGGQVFGYFFFGGYRGGAPDARAVEALERSGIVIDAERRAELLSASPECGPAREAALVHLLEMVASRLALVITDNLAHPEDRLPAVVERACAHAREHSGEALSLASVARSLSVSSSHLSRLFHHSTGLTFNEYLSRLRVERAVGLLRTTTRSITEIAYEAGFQSISRFNRVFKGVHGVSPREFRDRLEAGRPRPKSGAGTRRG